MIVRKALTLVLALALAVGCSAAVFAATGYTGNKNGGQSGGGTSTTSSFLPSGSSSSTASTSTTTLSSTNAVAAANSATGSSVTISNIGTVTTTVLTEMFAANESVTTAQFDQIVDGVVVGRIHIAEADVANLSSTIDLNVNVAQGAVANLFGQYFSNKVVTVGFGQSGSFGTSLQVAVKVDLTGLDATSLVFYSYDKATNTYQLIKDVTYTVDANGYLRFDTAVGGDIVITDSALARK